MLTYEVGAIQLTTLTYTTSLALSLVKITGPERNTSWSVVFMTSTAQNGYEVGAIQLTNLAYITSLVRSLVKITGPERHTSWSAVFTTSTAQNGYEVGAIQLATLAYTINPACLYASGSHSRR